MSVTFEVSKASASSPVREPRPEQPRNMENMLATFEVSKPDRSRESSLEQPENMEDMFVTLPVSKPETPRESRPEQS